MHETFWLGSICLKEPVRKLSLIDITGSLDQQSFLSCNISHQVWDHAGRTWRTWYRPDRRQNSLGFPSVRSDHPTSWSVCQCHEDVSRWDIWWVELKESLLAVYKQRFEVPHVVMHSVLLSDVIIFIPVVHLQMQCSVSSTLAQAQGIQPSTFRNYLILPSSRERKKRKMIITMNSLSSWMLWRRGLKIIHVKILSNISSYKCTWGDFHINWSTKITLCSWVLAFDCFNSLFRLFDKQQQYEEARDTIDELREEIRSLKQTIDNLQSDISDRHEDIQRWINGVCESIQSEFMWISLPPLCELHGYFHLIS